MGEANGDGVTSSVAIWYLDSRGWGDLPEGTALFWPVPYQELQVRGYADQPDLRCRPGVGNAPNSVAGKEHVRLVGESRA